MIVAQDETQQSAELRQAFLKHLPKRVEIVIKRGRRLTRTWDINAIALLHQDTQGLAGACGRYGLLDLGDRLYGIENFLQPFTEQYQFPTSVQAEQFARLMDELVPVAEREIERLGLGIAMAMQSRHADAPDTVQKVQTSVTPPPDFIARYAKTPPAMTPVLSAANSEFEAILQSIDGMAKVAAASTPAPLSQALEEPAAPARAEHAPSDIIVPTAATRTTAERPIIALREPRLAAARVYHLSDQSVFSRDLNRALEGKGFVVETLDDAEEMLEMIGALAPNVVLVDAPFLDQISALGPRLKTLRQKVNHRVGLLTITESAEINTRLKAMRAGSDIFLPHPSSVTEVIHKIDELLALETAEPYRVMIIEDDRSQALFAEQILRKAGMQTLAVMDPLSALDQIDSFRPELILMDLYMPGCDGMELTALIREREAFVSTPIVFLSGEHDAEKRFDALSAGGDDYLEKPVRPKFLITSVTTRVQRARALNRRTISANPRDSVSGMIERSVLLEQISGKIAHEDTQGNTGGVLFLMIDGAHNVRERAGLAAFDALMGQAGTYIASLIAEGEHCARYGDTTFFVFSPFRSEEDINGLAHTLVEQFSKHLFESEQRSITLALAVGIAHFAQGWPEAGGILNAAERAANQARSKPERVMRHQIAITQSQSGDDEALASLVKDALKFDQFQLVFQPIASLRGSSDEQFQAFLRLPAPGGRLFAAAAIIPAAESAGVIHGVDRWTAARCLMVAQDRLRQGRPVTLFAPHSIESTSDPQRGAWLKQQLENRRVPGSHLVIEFTAQDALSKVKQMAMFGEQLRPIGVRLCLSHFDANMSSYQLLQHMRIDYIKISSRYLVSDGNSKTKTELRALIDYARDKQIAIVATRVEDAQTAAMLWSSGVDYIQGNFVQQTTQDLEFDFRASTL